MITKYIWIPIVFTAIIIWLNWYILWRYKPKEKFVRVNLIKFHRKMRDKGRYTWDLDSIERHEKRITELLNIV